MIDALHSFAFSVALFPPVNRITRTQLQKMQIIRENAFLE
jgi:hypothetical protein